ncbi:zinc ribbon domain-containing protein [Anabaena sp. UHCC 0204]|uniref:zinc ribbon domain-containing protein n=1 Tax=Anabaena sp. UHCC 0204 TaxID=2590009 RepID=UPI001445877C|nr:zinc ribbon domain-containing protein [Anabaena sp. UHCC 0204]
MTQSKCPVCGHEYIEGSVEFCSKCHWLLTPYSEDLVEHPEVQKIEKQRLQSYQQLWDDYKRAYRRYSEVKQQLDAINHKNQSVPNYSSLEKYLQVLPDILSNIEQINEKLTSKDSYPVYESIQGNIQDQSDTALEDAVNPINNIVTDEEISSINDNQEFTDLLENYKQNQLDYTDKIEVSETEVSKSQRWTGSQAPAVFERNARGRGEYWIIDNKYLVPKPKHKINENSYKTTLVTLFDCRNYDKNSTDNITLIKPAKVSVINSEEKWRLEAKGIIEFS